MYSRKEVSNEDKKNTTAIETPVAADIKQSQIISKPIITEPTEKGNGDVRSSVLGNTLHTITMTELYDTVYPPRATLVEGLLYSGTFLFAGAPKVGKSFLMAQLGYHISMGLPIWDYPVKQGTVLYLALEDDYARLQRRLSKMYGVESTDKLHFAISAQHLESGLNRQIEQFIRQHDDLRMVIIDTLQSVRNVASDGEGYSYSGDYETIASLKHFGDQHGLCILIVHHTRKQGAKDSFDTISGTNGLLGAADGAFVMSKEERTDDCAVLDIVGRDQPEQKLYLQQDKERCIWLLTDAEKEVLREKPDPVLMAVAGLVSAEKPEWNGSATQLIEALQLEDMKPNVLTRRLNFGVDRLWNEYGIRYESSRNHDGRMVKLTLIDVEKA